MKEFTLHLCAVEKVLESPVEKDMTSQDLAGLKPPLKKNEPVQNLQRWLSHVRLSQNVIDLVLSSNVQCDIAIKSRLVCTSAYTHSDDVLDLENCYLFM